LNDLAKIAKVKDDYNIEYPNFDVTYPNYAGKKSNGQITEAVFGKHYVWHSCWTTDKTTKITLTQLWNKRK
ncbi:MAG: hypothetical protein LBS99_00085, partial [Clostridiales bacterium]|nr:hypothetical protein [Clostridiales bacterium]